MYLGQAAGDGGELEERGAELVALPDVAPGELERAVGEATELRGRKDRRPGQDGVGDRCPRQRLGSG